MGEWAVDTERRVRTYYIIWRAAKALVADAPEAAAIYADRCMVVGTLLAFSFEAISTISERICSSRGTTSSRSLVGGRSCLYSANCSQ